MTYVAIIVEVADFVDTFLVYGQYISIMEMAPFSGHVHAL